MQILLYMAVEYLISERHGALSFLFIHKHMFPFLCKLSLPLVIHRHSSSRTPFIAHSHSQKIHYYYGSTLVFLPLWLRYFNYGLFIEFKIHFFVLSQIVNIQNLVA